MGQLAVRRGVEQLQPFDHHIFALACALEEALTPAFKTYAAQVIKNAQAMARTIMVEKLNIPADVIEAQLAHSKSGPLGAAYDRAEFMEQRRKMMNEWADYLDKLRTAAGERLRPVAARPATCSA